jgi:hypothetical protein
LSVLSVWLLYFIGQALHVLLTAHLTIRSTLNALTSYEEYFRLRWMPLVCRIFLTTLAFMIIWANPRLFGLERLMPTLATQAAMAGILGWFSDSLFDKLVAMIPGLQRELPAMDVPTEQKNG